MGEWDSNNFCFYARSFEKQEMWMGKKSCIVVQLSERRPSRNTEKRDRVAYKFAYFSQLNIELLDLGLSSRACVRYTI